MFVSGGSLETASLETPKTLMFASCSQHVPIQCNILCWEMHRQLGSQQEHCSPPQACSSFHATFVVVPSFVSPKTASLQLAIDLELFMDVHGLSFSFLYRTTLISHATQNIVHRNCQLYHQYFRNIPLEILFQR